MKPFVISESHLTQYLKFQWESKDKEDYKPEKNASGLIRSINCKRVCKIGGNISKMQVEVNSNYYKFCLFKWPKVLCDFTEAVFFGHLFV